METVRLINLLLRKKYMGIRQLPSWNVLVMYKNAWAPFFAH